MENCVNPGDQLVVALYVQDIKRSSEFYLSYGFEVLRDEGTFMELKWEESRLFLAQVPGTPAPPPNPVANIRIMVANVDDYWELAETKGADILSPIGDRYYGLRDFTISGPDGVAIRFATWL